MTTYININGDVREASSLVVPADRTFRGAWSFNGDAVEVDMAAARDIHKDNLRAERKPRLEALDVAYMNALEAGQVRLRLQAKSKHCVTSQMMHVWQRQQHLMNSRRWTWLPCWENKL